MKYDLLHIEVQKFIRDFEGNITELALKGSPFENVEIKDLLIQIESRRKAEKKLPTWLETENVYYPPKLNLEQTSSEITAEFKATLVEGKLLADITGGFGVDSFYFAKKFEKVFHFELNEELSKIAEHNFKALNVENINCHAENGLTEVKTNVFDVIYADPSRRHETKGKVFFLKDCEPNIPENVSELLLNCKLLLIKTSPMLDISVGLSELKHVFQIHIVALNNEVKELLWLLKKDFEGNPKIKTINIKSEESDIFDFEWNTNSEAVYALPSRFLYEPNAAIMKSGAFEQISEAFKIKKLHKNTHLYTSESLREFPGRRFVIDKVLPYSKDALKNNLQNKQANITTRNFKETVAQIRKKWKISDGGNVYLFFVTDLEENRVVLVCSKI